MVKSDHGNSRNRISTLDRMYRFISINGFITMNTTLLTNELHQLTGRVDDKTEREERQIDQPLPPALLPW